MTVTSAPIETLSIPIDGLVEAAVRLGFGGGELILHKADPGVLVGGTFEGGVVHRTPRPGILELEPINPPRPLLTWQPVHWDVGLTSEIPVDLRLDTGANRSTIDLSALHVRRLELHTGASDTTVRLPAQGETAARIECGFAQVTVEVPAGVAAWIKGRMAIGATKVDETRFPREPDGWKSPGYETAVNRVYLEIDGAFGAVLVP